MTQHAGAVRWTHEQLMTPIGDLAILSDDAGRLRAVGFVTGHPRMERLLARPSQRGTSSEPAAHPSPAHAALSAYFRGDLTALEGVPVVLEGSDFQCTTWQALQGIPCGETRTYGDMARLIGKPNAVRAVGLANRANPIGIVVPCHRVIGADGSLTGYGGGVARKRWLLAHEQGARTLDLWSKA